MWRLGGLKMSKDEFINILRYLSPTELHEYIETKGKNGKAVCPVRFVDNKEDKNGTISD